jgi:hypothetical protein
MRLKIKEVGARRGSAMRYGFVLPGGDIWTIPEMAAEAEAAGWDGVFIPDCISIDTPDYPPGQRLNLPEGFQA